MAGGGASQQQGSDNSLAPLWIMALFFALGLALWYFAHDVIVSLIFSLKYYEGFLLSFFTSSLNDVLTIIASAPTDAVTFDELVEVSNIIGESLRYPLMVILIIFAIILYRSDITAKFRKIHNMDTLKKLEAENWPQINPVLPVDLVSEPVDNGPWAMAMPPLEFAIKNQVLKKEIIIIESKGRKKREGRYGILKAESKRVFTMQLGDYWEDVSALKPHVKALFAIFAAKICRDRTGSAALARQINMSVASKGGLNFAGVDALLEKNINNPEIKKICSKHAYIYTVMASLLEKCREDGVFPASEFLWLKPLDRRLWFTLNTVGRQTPFTEVAGVFAHWVAEKELKRKCMVPMVDEAVKGLEIAISEIKYTPEDEEGVS